MKTSFKTGFAQIFSSCPPPPKWGAAENFGGGGCSPPRPPGPYGPLNETKNDKLFFKQLRSSYLSG